MSESPTNTCEAPAKSKEENHISPDGKWETMSRPPGMLRYIPSGVFYVRVKYKGTLLGPKSLEADDYSEASARLPNCVKELKQRHDEKLRQSSTNGPTTWRQAAAEFIRDSENLYKLGSIQQGALDARITNVRKIQFFWPSMVDAPARQVQSADALEFIAEARTGTGRFVSRPRPQGFGTFQKGMFLGGAAGASTLSRLLWVGRVVMDRAIKMDKAKGLGEFDNPFCSVPRPTVRPGLPPLPSEDEFEQILDEILNNACPNTTEESRFST